MLALSWLPCACKRCGTTQVIHIHGAHLTVRSYGAQSTGPLMLMPASSAFRNLSVPEAPPLLFNAGPVPLT